MLQSDTILQLYNQLMSITREVSNIKGEVQSLVLSENNDVQILNQKIDSIQIAMDNIAISSSNDAQIQTALNVMSQSYDAISNQIAMVNVIIAVFALLFAIAAIGLGVYVSNKVNSVKKSLKLIESKRHAINETARKVERLNNEIQSDLEGLYARLQDEETLALLRRLDQEPLDIANLAELLFARCLDDKGYPILKSAYIKSWSLEDADDIIGVKADYATMFFQHYTKLMTLDDEIRDKVFEMLTACMESAFQNDIRKSTDGFCDALLTPHVTFDKELILCKYLKSLNESRYSNFAALRTIMEEKLPAELLQAAIARCTADKVYLSLFDIKPPANTQEN